MKRLIDIYTKNNILQFLVSYVIVLIILLTALMYGFHVAFQVVENQIKQSSSFVLEQGMHQIDEEIQNIHSMALQISQSTYLRNLASNTRLDVQYLEDLSKTMEEYYGGMRYQSITLNYDSYIYLKLRDKILYDNSIYRTEVFEQHLKKWDLPYEKWEQLYENNGERNARFITTSNNDLYYVMPFYKLLSTENLGVIVYRLDGQGIRDHLSFLDDYMDYSIFIKAKSGEIIWQEDLLGYHEQFNKLDLKGNGSTEIDEKQITYITSPSSGWEYILVLPQEVALSKLVLLKGTISIVVIIATIIVIFISIIWSYKKGRPINVLVDLVEEQADAKVNLGNMSQVVQGILKDHQNLLHELEEDQSALQKTFLHNLIKAEFINSTELEYMAKKTGMPIDGKTYYVVSFKLFAHNDFDSIDEQTLEEVRIISKLVTHYLLQHYSDEVWFYKRNTLQNIGIFRVDNSYETLREIIEQTNLWLQNEYHIETNWGISLACHNLLDIWKNCEEATLAMESCQDKEHIIAYSINLEKRDEFYFPYIVEEKIMAGIKSGSFLAVENMLKLLQNENFTNRFLDRKRFIKFNRRMLELLSNHISLLSDADEKILWLNEVVIDYQGEYEEYFRRIQVICKSLCMIEEEKKKAQRRTTINQIIEYVQTNFSDPGLGLGKVSMEFDMSESYLSAIFKEGSGINFGEFLEQIRIETSCTMLEENIYSVGDIAGKVGYNSIQSFRRAFKRVMNVSPREYRDSKKEHIMS